MSNAKFNEEHYRYLIQELRAARPHIKRQEIQKALEKKHGLSLTLEYISRLKKKAIREQKYRSQHVNFWEQIAWYNLAIDETLANLLQIEKSAGVSDRVRSYILNAVLKASRDRLIIFHRLGIHDRAEALAKIKAHEHIAPIEHIQEMTEVIEAHISLMQPTTTKRRRHRKLNYDVLAIPRSRRPIHTAVQVISVTTPQPKPSLFSALEQSILLDGLQRILRAGRIKPAAHKKREQRREPALVAANR